MKKIRILAIGNSFSQDAFGHLHNVAKEFSLDVETVNLYIGGCDLARHHKNMVEDLEEYEYEKNAVMLHMSTIDAALAEGDWDYISFQQVSHATGKPATYAPYLTELVAHVREKCPKAELLLHETWAYEWDSTHGGFAFYENDQVKMYNKLYNAYCAAAHRHGLHIIPSGEVVQAVRGVAPFLYKEGGYSLCRDGFHMHFEHGRYLVALTWLSELFGIRASESRYVPGEVCDEQALSVLRETVDTFFQKRLQK